MITDNVHKVSSVFVSIPLTYISITRSQLQTYPCHNNSNYLWNMGFLLFPIIVLQIVSGMLLVLHYYCVCYHSYYSVMHIIREVYYGWSVT